MHAECKYCDNPMPPTTCGGDLICSRCGAEWADARMICEDEEYESLDIDEDDGPLFDDYDDDWEDDQYE
ncbi:hypothetical protein [Paenibacillus sp. IHBB 3054]|uniref:hypothetical protein n=1 Tax=Paenibacillus sp. IHBB 3054 TaxID=3425689 RepID=UPI003F67558F